MFVCQAGSFLYSSSCSFFFACQAGFAYVAMAYEEGSEASLGRRCKAKAKAKAKEPDFVREWKEQFLERAKTKAAEELRAAQRDAEVRDAWRNEAASQGDPWADMAEVDSAADSLPDSVVHADTHGVVSFIVSPGSGVPCTSCHVVHRGQCSFHDVLRAEIEQLKLYADHFVPRTEDFAELRDALYQLMANIHGYLAHGGLTPEKYTDILLEVRSAKRHCERSVCDR